MDPQQLHSWVTMVTASCVTRAGCTSKSQEGTEHEIQTSPENILN